MTALAVAPGVGIAVIFCGFPRRDALPAGSRCQWGDLDRFGEALREVAVDVLFAQPAGTCRRGLRGACGS